MKQVNIQTSTGMRKTVIVSGETTINDIVRNEGFVTTGTLAHINGDPVRSAGMLDKPVNELCAEGESTLMVAFITKNTNAA